MEFIRGQNTRYFFPEVFKFCPADWPKKYFFSGQSASRLQALGSWGRAKKEKANERKNKGGIRRGREGREPVRIFLTPLFCPPLPKSKNANLSVDSHGS